MRALCVVVHDVAPANWPQAQDLIAMVRSIADIPLTLLVVPDLHGKGAGASSSGYLQGLADRLAAGDELALHGWNHQDTGSSPRNPADWFMRSVYTAREGEFAALSFTQASNRIEWGRGWFRQHGWTAEGFVAPAWLMSAGSLRAVRQAGFLYTTTAGRFVLPAAGISLAARSLCYSSRSAPRRTVSLAWNAALARLLRENLLMRIALHPADAGHPMILRQVRAHIVRALENRVALTKAQFAAALLASVPDRGESARTEPAPRPSSRGPQRRARAAPSTE